MSALRTGVAIAARGVKTLTLAVALLMALGWGPSLAATPTSATLSDPEGAGVSWKGKRFTDSVSPPVPEACTVSGCDQFVLNVALPDDVWERPGGVQVGIRWADEAQDLDLYVYRGGQLAAKSDGFFASTGESVLLKHAANGRYRVVVVPRFAEDLTYRGIAQVERFPARMPLRNLLPDLVPLASRNLHFDIGAYLFDPGVPGEVTSCYPEETLEQGAERCLRFDQIIANVGAGPFELRYRMDGLATDQELRQRIYRSNGTSYDRVADTYEFHPTHAHFHYKNFALSRLWRSNASGERLGSRPVRTGRKNGFCMIDVDNIWFGRKGDAARTYYFPRCNAPTETDATGSFMVNGISVGWADVYNWYLADQFIEVSGLPDGYYVLETKADPKNTIVELDEGDNTRSVLIRICGDQAEIVGRQAVC